MARHSSMGNQILAEHEQSVDLRRKRRADLAAELVTRAKWLPAEERELIRTVYEHGRPVSELAPLLCVSPRTLRRRCRRAVSRALSEEYLFVLRHRDRWPSLMAQVATMCMVEGKSLRTAAAALGVSFHTVRRYRALVVGLMETSAEPPHAGTPAAEGRSAAQVQAAFAPAWQSVDPPRTPPPRKDRPHRVVKKARPFRDRSTTDEGGDL